MNLLSSDLKGYENQTLYLIGNGFDLIHNIPSTYSHFYHWLKSKGEDDFINRMEFYFPSMRNGELLLWKDFESAIGQYDINRIFEEATVGLDRELDERTKNAANIILDPVVKRIKPLIKEWVKQIDLSQVKPQLCLPLESWYLTFNYTLTLEKIYKIPVERICHIHNSINDEAIVVGHNHLFDPDAFGKEIIDWYEESSKRNIAETMNNMYKNTFKIKIDHEDFFEKINGLKRIVVIGHSISEADEQYFGYIKGVSDDDAHWHISKYRPSDETQIAYFLEHHKIDNKNRWIFNL